MPLKKLTAKHKDMALEIALGADKREVADKYNMHCDHLYRLCASEPLFSDEIERNQAIIGEHTIAQWRNKVVDPMLKELGNVTEKLITLATKKGISEQVQRSAAMDIINTVKTIITGKDEEEKQIPQLRVEVLQKPEDTKLTLIDKKVS